MYNSYSDVLAHEFEDAPEVLAAKVKLMASMVAASSKGTHPCVRACTHHPKTSVSLTGSCVETQRWWYMYMTPRYLFIHVHTCSYMFMHPFIFFVSFFF